MDVKSDIESNIQRHLLNFYQHHMEKQHPHETETIQTQVKKTTTYIIMSQLDKMIQTEHD
jgi:hypothetical protein